MQCCHYAIFLTAHAQIIKLHSCSVVKICLISPTMTSITRKHLTMLIRGASWSVWFRASFIGSAEQSLCSWFAVQWPREMVLLDEIWSNMFILLLRRETGVSTRVLYPFCWSCWSHCFVPRPDGFIKATLERGLDGTDINFSSQQTPTML